VGRATQGVRLINLDEGDRVIDCAVVEQGGEDDGAGERQAALESAPSEPESPSESDGADSQGPAGEDETEGDPRAQ